MPPSKRPKRSKSRRHLSSALAELITVKELKNISVTELTQKADVHRSTFYHSFENIEALYQSVE